jgi:formamidopyrimidine-DNA glycosylase
MPELAEVEYYRKQWDSGVGSRILRVALHEGKRIFRGTDTSTLQAKLKGTTLVRSEARGKQMAFQFSQGRWVALHLGMTGKLRVEDAGFEPVKHDHLVLFQAKRALVFSDPRLFGRVLFFEGKGEPPWWSAMAPALTSPAFTEKVLRAALLRHRRLPIKAGLLLQRHFPGVGNWMADEILWRAKLDPRRASGDVTAAETNGLWKEIRFVCREAMRHVGTDFSDPPANWLFHERWGRAGKCPRDGSALAHATIGGRTTAWCRKCQT